MPSRRTRKRYRSPAANAGLRGDRQRPPTDDFGNFAGGVGGKLCGDWENASLSDLRLLRHAINENWLVPVESRRQLMQALCSILRSEDFRIVMSACQVVITAENYNLKLEEAERRAKEK